MTAVSGSEKQSLICGRGGRDIRSPLEICYVLESPIITDAQGN